jgi:hypothetical protein
VHTTHNEPRIASNGPVAGDLEIEVVYELDERRIAKPYFQPA